MRRTPLFACAAAIFLLLVPPVHAAKRCVGQDDRPATTSAERVTGATLCLLNKERAKRHRKRLRHDAELHAAAMAYAKQMARRNFFDHVEPDGDDLLDRIRRTTYLDEVTGWALGENIAWGSGRLATPREIVRSWMSSPGHKRNILDKRFTDIGIGVAIGAPVKGGPGDAATWSTEFGTRK